MTRTDRLNTGWTRVVLLSAILISSLLITINRGAAREASRLQTATQDTVTPLAALVSIPLRKTEDIFGSLADRATAFDDNAALRERVAILEERQARYENLAMKVARYEAILGVDTQTDVPMRKIASRAVGETDGPFVRSLLLNVGAKSGVIEGNPVMSVEGLVGHVINVGIGSSRVLRLSDLNSRIAVTSARSDATAILAGDNTAQPKLAFINQRTDWKAGDRVITSGDDGSLPRGLAVGVAALGAEGELRVQLATDRAALDWVWVVPYAPVEAPSDDVEEPSEIDESLAQ